MHQLALRIKPYIQPFEKVLALEELQTLAGAMPQDCGNGIHVVQTSKRKESILRRLAYWEAEVQEDIDYTTQARRESTVNLVRNGVPTEDLLSMLPFPDGNPIPLGNRRSLRYGTHGIHEYRGKFFPQLVLALLNASEVPTRGIVADPMCGSGTTVVESALAGVTGIGTDMNPLSIFMARVKCDLLRVEPEELDAAYKKVREVLLNHNERLQNGLPYFWSLPKHDQEYLQNWFSQRTLENLDAIMTAIETHSSGVIADFFKLALSNILRSVSWQKESDLRVRKELKPDGELDPLRSFLEEVGRSVRFVLGLLCENRRVAVGSTFISEGDARHCGKTWARWAGKVDAVITSPPYATALPYLDTDRLSLSYLGLLPRSEHRKRDWFMVGNREITDKTRRDLWTQFKATKSNLPTTVIALIERVDALNSASDTGFRRRNLSALLSKYFTDMHAVLSGIHAVLKVGGKAHIVVGNNSTTAGGEKVDIKTAELIAEMAEMVGFHSVGHVGMEILAPRGIFKANAIPSEQILRFQK